jgi:lysyl-tRNA synthetase class 1
LENYEAVANVVLPTLRAERRATYSPFLPVSPKTGRVLQVPLIAHDAAAGTVAFEDEDGTRMEVPVTGGHCKLQWRVDWAMRWTAFGVDYEMSGKDLIDSVKLGTRICRILGGTPPEGFTYELFLDENGEKISKSRGNGLAVEDWLKYAPPESLALFMYHQPTRAKRLYFDVIPRAVDDYLAHLESYRAKHNNPAEQLENPAWHIHAGNPPPPESGITFGLLLNLVGVCNTDDAGMLWKFISRYAPEATPQTAPILDRLVSHAITYFRDFVRPAKKYRAPTETERAALEDLARTLEALPAGADAEAIQNEVYEVGKRHGFANLREWFGALYETLLGQTQGPRMGSFIALYGRAETVALIRRVLAGESLAVA